MNESTLRDVTDTLQQVRDVTSRLDERMKNCVDQIRDLMERQERHESTYRQDHSVIVLRLTGLEGEAKNFATIGTIVTSNRDQINEMERRQTLQGERLDQILKAYTGFTSRALDAFWKIGGGLIGGLALSYALKHLGLPTP